MKRGFELLERAVGRSVNAVTVSTWFYGAESAGETGDALITLEGGQVMALGCAGDGSVLITRVVRESDEAPNMTTIRTEIPGLKGEVQGVSEGDSWLRIGIGERTILLTNADDQMVIAVDGKGLSKRYFHR